MSSEAFGSPDAADVLIAIGTTYFARGLLTEGLRLFVAGIPRDVAIAALQSVAIDLASVPHE